MLSLLNSVEILYSNLMRMLLKILELDSVKYVTYQNKLVMDIERLPSAITEDVFVDFT